MTIYKGQKSSISRVMYVNLLLLALLKGKPTWQPLGLKTEPCVVPLMPHEADSCWSAQLYFTLQFIYFSPPPPSFCDNCKGREPAL